MTGLRFRPARAGDADTLQDLLNVLARYDGTVTQGTAAALRRYGFGPQPLFQAVLAEQAGEVLGFVLFFPEFSTLRGRPGVFVQDLYVREPARGNGLGRKLLAQAFAAAQAWDAAYLALMADRSNTKANAFYRTCGFAKRGDYENLVLEGAGLAALNRA